MQTALNSHILSVMVDASSIEFQTYKSGLYDSPNCGNSVNHAVKVVGWGTDSASDSNYWLVRNEWGKTWDEYGKMKLAIQEGQGTWDVQMEPKYVKV